MIKNKLDVLVEEAREKGYGAYYSKSIFTNLYTVVICNEDAGNSITRVYWSKEDPEFVEKDFLECLNYLESEDKK